MRHGSGGARYRSREIARHGGRSRYRATRAERTAQRARRQPKTRKINADAYLRLVVVELLKQGRLPVYFAHPHSPWERGTNDNTNR